MTSPSNGATFAAPATLTVSGTASDPDGSIALVQIFINGQLASSGQPTNGQISASWFDVPAGTYTFTVVATDDQDASTTFSATVTVIDAGGLPNGWIDADVGATGAQGSAVFANGTFTVRGAGADVWGTADAFNYAYTRLSGDGSITARVATVSSEANWVKAGVMIRGSLSPSSAQAFMLVSHAKGVAFQRRVADGNVSVSTSGAMATAPHWVKLARNGNMITAYASADGAAWTMVGTDTFAMGTDVYVGLAVSSHVGGTLATASFDQVSLAGGAPSQCSSVTVSRTFFYSGGPASTWQIDVTAPTETCTWTASIDKSWLVLNGVAGPTAITGKGSGRVTLQTLDNRAGAKRVGTFTIGGAAYSVTQEPF
jgi:regulation of enolase protein 1 (concanavalin A-like superfamily)